MKTVIFLILFTLFKSLSVCAQIDLRMDTLRYKISGGLADTFYYVKRELKKNLFEMTFYSGITSDLLTYRDTFIIANSEWKKIYNNNEIPFLSVADFLAKKKTLEYIDREKRDILYYEYTPIKQINVESKVFYLYMVREMSGKGMVESLGEGPFFIAFNFNAGEIYRRTYHITKVLEGYEKYISYFK